MLMGVALLLLLVGGFPLIGVPAVYHSWLMMVVGVVAVLLCLWGGWRIANGLRAQFVCGFICTFFACAGVVVLWQYGCRAVEYALLGGVMWFGALAMACTAVVGGLFTGIFLDGIALSVFKLLSESFCILIKLFCVSTSVIFKECTSVYGNILYR